jgi:hypothetical protein
MDDIYESCELLKKENENIEKRMSKEIGVYKKKLNNYSSLVKKSSKCGMFNRHLEIVEK